MKRKLKDCWHEYGEKFFKCRKNETILKSIIMRKQNMNGSISTDPPSFLSEQQGLFQMRSKLS